MTQLTLMTEPTRTASGRKRREQPLTDEGLIPLHHLWYESKRLRRYVCDAMCLPEPSVYTVLHNAGDAAGAKRWGDLTSGRTEYIRLDAVDRMFVTLQLSLYALGEADVWCSMPPSHAIRTGRALIAPPTIDNDAIAA